MHLPREVMLSQRRAKRGELWERGKSSGSHDRITVFTQQVFVTQVPQQLTEWSPGYYFLCLNLVHSLFQPIKKHSGYKMEQNFFTS